MQRFKHRLKKRQVRAKRLKGAEPQSPPASTSLSSSASATDSEDEIVDRLIRGPPAPGDDDNDDHLFARPQAPPGTNQLIHDAFYRFRSVIDVSFGSFFFVFP